MCVPRTPSVSESPNVSGDDALFCLLLTLFASPFKSKSRLEAENAALRHQGFALQRRVRGRVQLTNGDRLFLILLYRWFPSVLKAIELGTGVRNPALFAADPGMSAANPLWEAPRIHGELLKLGF